MKLIYLPVVVAFLLVDLCFAQGEGPEAKPGGSTATKSVVQPSGREIINKDVIVEQLSTTGGGPDAGSIAFSSNAILFGYGSAVLREASHPQLMEIAKALNDPALSTVPFFLVDGHTCNIGTEERNCRLSWARAQSVVKYLVDKGGVPPERLKARGFGQKVPMVSNDTETNRQKNRRVVLKSGLLELEREKKLQCGVEK